MVLNAPTSVSGLNVVKAVGSASGSQASAPFQVTPSVSIVPSSGVAGQTITAIGQNFSPGSTLQVSLVNPAAPASSAGTSLGTSQVSSNGTVAQFTIPGGQQPGIYNIVFTNPATGASTATLFRIL